MNHYVWLEENLNAFWIKVLGRSLEDSYCAGIIGSDGDKCYQYRQAWEDAGIPFPHGVAIYMLGSVPPFSLEVRETKMGWVAPKDWVIRMYPKFKKYLPPIPEN